VARRHDGRQLIMKIVSLLGDQRIEVVDRPTPEPAADEVLIRTAVSAICGSEMNGYRGKGSARDNSGHEGAGIVTAVGGDVTELKVGDRVGISAVVGCGHCEQCAAGRYTWCPNNRGTANVHAEYFTHTARGCHLLPDDVAWDAGVLITGDGLGVPFHTSSRLAERPYGTVAVFGLGPVGLGAVMLQSHLGRTVVGVDLSEARLQLATELGAAATVRVTPDQDIPAAVREALGGVAPEVCIEAAGVPATAKLCFTTVRTGGRVVFNGEQGPLELSPSADFIRRDISAHGAWFYHFNEYPQMLDLARGGLEPARLVTHRFTIDDAQEAYRAMAAGLTGKVLLTYS